MGKALGEFEQLILFALLDLAEEDAYGVNVRETIEGRTGRGVSTGAVYTALDRLSDRGLVESRVGAPTAERGGRRKRLYRLTPAGASELQRAVRIFQDCRAGCCHVWPGWRVERSVADEEAAVAAVAASAVACRRRAVAGRRLGRMVPGTRFAPTVRRAST